MWYRRVTRAQARKSRQGSESEKRQRRHGDATEKTQIQRESGAYREIQTQRDAQTDRSRWRDM